MTFYAELTNREHRFLIFEPLEGICLDLDSDCLGIPAAREEREGHPHLDPRHWWGGCYLGDPSRGACPFVD